MSRFHWEIHVLTLALRPESCRYPRNHIWTGLPRETDRRCLPFPFTVSPPNYPWKISIGLQNLATDISPCSRRQHERPAQRHHRHCARRPSQSSRSSLYPREPREILHRTGHVEVCDHSPLPVSFRKRNPPLRHQRANANAVRCFSRNAPMFRSRGVRGRGVGMARGRATVNRARGQRGPRGG